MGTSRDVQRWARFHKQRKQLELLKLKDEGWRFFICGNAVIWEIRSWFLASWLQKIY